MADCSITLSRLSVPKKWGEAIPNRITNPISTKRVCRRAANAFLLTVGDMTAVVLNMGLGARKTLLHSTAGQVLFIDDNPGHIERAAELGLKTHLFTSEAGFNLLLASLGITTPEHEHE